jgi:hypothetical protein
VLEEAVVGLPKIVRYIKGQELAVINRFVLEVAVKTGQMKDVLG